MLGFWLGGVAHLGAVPDVFLASTRRRVTVVAPSVRLGAPAACAPGARLGAATATSPERRIGNPVASDSGSSGSLA
jgi:hypothetical protein